MRAIYEKKRHASVLLVIFVVKNLHEKQEGKKNSEVKDEDNAIIIYGRMMVSRIITQAGMPVLP